MNDENRQDALNWYAPLTQAADGAAKEKAPAKKKKRLSAPWRVTLGTLLLLGLIAGSSLFFADGESGNPIQIEQPIVISDPTQEMPEDWQDFLNSYYVVENSSRVATKIPAVEKRPDWQLELKPAGKMKKDLQKIYRTCVPSIVGIRGYVDGSMDYFWGSGIIMSEDGLILTNAHLLEGCDSATVILSDDSSYEAKLVGTDSISDIAVLKIEAEGLIPAEFGDSEALTVGDTVAAIGNPLGENFRATLTDGIVSAIDRGVSYNGREMNLIQTNTAINEGSSGGALVNMYGQVVGVTNMKMMSAYSSIEGIAFAIPSATARSVANALIREGEVRGRPAVGVTVGAVPDTASEHYDIPEGLYVSAVSENSDAKEKGIREGDIIIAVNGEPARTTNDILRVKDALYVGDTINFTIWRDGESFDVDIVLVDTNDVYG